MKKGIGWSTRPSTLNAGMWTQAEIMPTPPVTVDPWRLRHCATTDCGWMPAYRISTVHLDRLGRRKTKAFCPFCAAHLPPSLRPADLWTPEHGYSEKAIAASAGPV